MFARFSTLLVPQVRRDEDQTRIITLLNAIIICGIAVVLLNLAVRLIFAPETFVFSWVSGATLGLLGGLWLLVRRGYVRAVSAGLSAGIWLLVTIAVFNFGTGIFAPSFAFYTVILVITGLTLGTRSAALMGVLTVFTSFYMAFIAAQGNLFTAAGVAPAVLLWLNSSLAFLLIVFLTWLANRGILKALGRARTSEHILSQQNEALRISQAALQVKTESLATINAIAATLHSSLDFQTVVEHALREIQTYAHAPGSTLYFFDNQTDQMQLFTYAGFMSSSFTRMLPINSKADWQGTLVAAAFQEKRIIVSEDFATDTRLTNPETRQAILVEGFVSGAAIPLILHEKVMGVLGLLFTEKRHLAEEEQATLLAIGNTIALAIDNAQKVTRIEAEITERHRAEAATQTAEDKYRGIVENAIEGIFQSTRAGRILTANPSFANMLGYDSPQTLMSAVTNIGQQLYVDPQRREDIARQIDLNGEVRAQESQLYRRDGSIIWLSINARSVHDDQGQFVCFEGMVEDITTRKQAEENLRQTNLRLEASHDTLERLIQQMPIGIQMFDTNGVCTNTNEAHKVIFGMESREQVVGKFNILSDHMAQVVGTQEGYKRALSGEVADMGEINFDFQYADPHFTATTGGRFLRVSFFPIYDENHTIVGVVALNEDVTERRRAEDAQRAAERDFRIRYERLSRALRAAGLDTWIWNRRDDSTTYPDTDAEIARNYPKTLTEFYASVHSDDCAMLKETIDQATAAEKEFNSFYRYLSQGKVEWHYIQGIPEFDAEGTFVSFSGFTFDITARRIAEEGLRESEERFRLISSVTTDYTYSSRINEQGELEQGFLTGAVETITGYTPEEFIAQGGWRPMLHPDEKENDARNFEALKQNQRVDFETRIIRKDGDVRHVRVYGIPVWDEVQQKLIGINGAVQDITERCLALEALQQSEARFRAIFEDTSVGITVTDRQGHFVAVNPAYESLLGYSSDELHQLTFSDLTYPDDLPGNLDLFEQFLSGEIDHYQLEKRYLHKDGRQIPVRLNASRFSDYTTSEDFLIIHVEDITEIKQAQARQLELAVAIERARVDVLKEFLGSATHDLRTPLTVMNTSIYLLRKSSESEKQIQYIDRLEAQTQHIHQLIESLFRLSRLDLAEAEFEFAECDLNLLVEEVVDQHQPLAHSKQHQLALDVHLNLLWIRADATELREALHHLIVNACNYTPDGGHIRVNTLSEDGQAVIEVSDDGIGIGDAELPLIFERFYRADKARQIATGAAGLGLTITRKIVEAHQGQISAASTVGTGSTFRICLPLTPKAET